jgi:PAS domain S-box-containing protein
MMNKPINILVFDDITLKPRRIAKLVSALDRTEIRAEYVTTSEAALVSLGRNVHDVCVIDTFAGNGPALLRGARQLGCTLPVIAVASRDAGEAIAVFREGAADCLLRDELNLPQLERSIHCAIERAREHKLKNERELRYLALVENAREVIFTHGCAGEITSVNKAGELLTGYTRKEFRQLNVFDVVATEHRELVREMMRRTLDERRQTSYEAGIVKKCGQHLLVLITTHLVYSQGQPIALQSMAHASRQD